MAKLKEKKRRKCVLTSFFSNYLSKISVQLISRIHFKLNDGIGNKKYGQRISCTPDRVIRCFTLQLGKKFTHVSPRRGDSNDSNILKNHFLTFRYQPRVSPFFHYMLGENLGVTFVRGSSHDVHVFLLEHNQVLFQVAYSVLIVSSFALKHH